MVTLPRRDRGFEPVCATRRSSSASSVRCGLNAVAVTGPRTPPRPRGRSGQRVLGRPGVCPGFTQTGRVPVTPRSVCCHCRVVGIGPRNRRVDDRVLGLVDCVERGVDPSAASSSACSARCSAFLASCSAPVCSNDMRIDARSESSDVRAFSNHAFARSWLVEIEAFTFVRCASSFWRSFSRLTAARSLVSLTRSDTSRSCSESGFMTDLLSSASPTVDLGSTHDDAARGPRPGPKVTLLGIPNVPTFPRRSTEALRGDVRTSVSADRVALPHGGLRRCHLSLLGWTVSDAPAASGVKSPSGKSGRGDLRPYWSRSNPGRLTTERSSAL